MTQTIQEQFEKAFSDDNGGLPVAFIKLQRLGESYSAPRVARAWYWFKRSREMLVVELPPLPEAPEDPEEAIDDSHMDAYHSAIGMRHACSKFIEAAGIKVSP